MFGNYNSIMQNGLKVETNLDVFASGSLFQFGDGSWYDADTGKYRITGRGWIKINGIRLKKTHFAPTPEIPEFMISRTFTFIADTLDIQVNSGNATVTPHPGYETFVTLMGPQSIVDAAWVYQRKASVTVLETPTPDFFASKVKAKYFVASGDFVTHDNEERGPVMRMDVYVPFGTPIRATSDGSGSIHIGRVDGRLKAVTNGTGNIIADEVRGDVTLESRSRGGIRINGGDIGLLKATSYSVGRIRVCAKARDAALSAMSVGGISVDRVLHIPFVHHGSTGRVKIKRLGAT